MIQERFEAFAALGAMWVLWLLVGLSILSVALMIERLVVFIGLRGDVVKLREDLAKMLRNNDVEGARKMLESSRCVEAQIVRAGLLEADRGPASAEEAMAGAAKEARIKLERGLAFLGTVGNNAPFVGLFGTCIGIIKALPQLSDPAATAGVVKEISEALAATAIGLLVAIPAVATFNYFMRLVKTRMTRADALGHVLLAYLKTRAPTPTRSPSSRTSSSAAAPPATVEPQPKEA